MPNSISPQTYLKLIWLVLGKEAAVTAFTFTEFLANGGKQIILNSPLQYSLSSFVLSKDFIARRLHKGF